MIPKEKAEELFSKFYSAIPNNEMGENYESAKQCAIIAVDAMIESYEFDVISDMTNQRYIDKINYLDEVRHEINKL
jgi:hypothetical protein